MLVQHSWLLFTQLQPLIPSCFPAVTESDLVNLKVSEQWPGPHYQALQDNATGAHPKGHHCLLTREREGHRAGYTTTRISANKSNKSAPPCKKKAMQSAGAEPLPGSKPSPYSLPCNALFQLSSLTDSTLQADVLRSSSFTIPAYTLQQNLSFCFSLCYPKKDGPGQNHPVPQKILSWSQHKH